MKSQNTNYLLNDNMKSNVAITKIQLAASPKTVEAVVPVPSDTTSPVENADANPAEVEPPQKEAEAEMSSCPHCNGSGKVAKDDYAEEEKHEETAKADEDDAEMKAEEEKEKEPVAMADATPTTPVKVDPYAKGKQLKHANTGRYFNKSLPISERQKAFAEKMAKVFPLDDYDKQLAEWKKKNNL